MSEAGMSKAVSSPYNRKNPFVAAMTHHERLTQPDKIAIVYTLPKEGEEYMEYIEYLIEQGLLKGEVEQLELEELQGVIGLKAFRISVNVDVDQKEASKLKSEAYKG